MDSMKNFGDSSFEEKKAVEYVERLGMEMAIEKLSLLASKSSKAGDVLDVILSWQKEEDKPKQTCQPQTGFVNNSFQPRRQDVSQMTIGPEERFMNMIDRLGLSYDIQADSDWNPIVSVEWRNGYAAVNGHRVTFSKDHMSFMRKNVLNQKRVVFNMHLLNVNDHGVVAEPDTDDFFRRQRHKEKNQVKEFEASVLLGDRGLHIRSTAVCKRIIVPKRYMAELLVKRGLWKFTLVDEDDNSVLAIPVKRVVDDSNPVIPSSDESQHLLHRRQRKSENWKRLHRQGFVEKTVNKRMDDLFNNGKVNL